MAPINTIITGLKIAASAFCNQFDKQEEGEEKDYITLREKLSIQLLQSGKAKYPELLRESLEKQGVDITAPVEINTFEARFLLAKEEEVESHIGEINGYCKTLFDALDKEMSKDIRQVTYIKDNFNRYVASLLSNENERFLFAFAIKLEWYKRVNELATEVKEKKLDLFSDNFDSSIEKLEKYLVLDIIRDSEYDKTSDLLFNIHNEASLDDLLNFSREQVAKNFNHLIVLSSIQEDKTTSS